jgi:hypothetical protein
MKKWRCFLFLIQAIIFAGLFAAPASAYPTLDLYCKCGSVSSYEIDSISKITFGTTDIILSGVSQSMALTNVRKIVFNYLPSQSEGRPFKVNTFSRIYPNPFNPLLLIDLDVNAKEDLNAAVFNCLGQKERLLFSGKTQRGRLRLCWDGKNDQGRQLAGGAYVLRLIYRGKIFTSRIMYAK